jgi:large subunit ribosomal protein L17
MRHGRKTIKLQRRQDHRNALLANLVVSLIEYEQIKTTLAKAKAVRPFAEKLVTLGKRGDLHARRIALGHLTNNKAAVTKLFATIAPAAAARQGGYTRITKLGQRLTDSAPMAFIEWVDRVTTPAGDAAEAPAAEAAAAEKPKKKAAPKKAEAAEGETTEAKPKAKAKKAAKTEE